jgi:hypothetical protein
MHFQLRTDNHIKNGEDLADRVRDEVEAALTHRHAAQVRRVEVYLQDVNAGKGGRDDIRCSIEISLAGHQPVAAHDSAHLLEEAVTGAVEKVSRVLEHTFGKLDDRGGKVSMSGEGT